VPAAIVIGLKGESKLTDLLILSQVILSFQCLSRWCRCDVHQRQSQDGEFVNRRWLCARLGVTLVIIAFNAELLRFSGATDTKPGWSIGVRACGGSTAELASRG